MLNAFLGADGIDAQDVESRNRPRGYNSLYQISALNPLIKKILRINYAGDQFNT